MRLFAHDDSVPHGFGAVCLALFQRYPNPHAAHVQSSDVVARAVASDGRLHTLRLMAKAGFTAGLPAVVRAVLPRGAGGQAALVVEESVVDGARGVMAVRTCNVTHRRLLQIEESLVFRRVSVPCAGSRVYRGGVGYGRDPDSGGSDLADGASDNGTCLHAASREHTAIETRARFHSGVATALETIGLARFAEQHLTKSRKALLLVLNRVYDASPSLRADSSVP